MRTTVFATKITIISNKFICCKINSKYSYNNFKNKILKFKFYTCNKINEKSKCANFKRAT